MMVDQLYLVILKRHKLRRHLFGNLTAPARIGLVGQLGVVAGNGIAQFAGLLGHLAADGIYRDIRNALRTVGLDGLLHQADNIAIKAST